MGNSKYPDPSHPPAGDSSAIFAGLDSMPGALWRLAWTCSSDGMLLFLKDGTILGVNPRIEEVLGYPQGTLIKGHLRDIFGEDDLQQISHFVEQIVSSPDAPESSKRLPVQALHISGERRSLELSITHMLLDGATVFVGLARDVTEVERTRAALAQEQARFNTFFQNSNDALFVHDRTGVILEANRVAIDAFGYSLEELRTRTIGSLHPPNCPTAPQNMDISVGETIVFDSMFATKLGETFPARVRVQKVLLGTEPMNVSTVTDERREQLMREQMVRAEKLEAVSRMAGALAHDFNNLLMVAHAASIELTELGGLTEEQRQIATDIHYATEQASALASRLTGVARSHQPLEGTTDLAVHVPSISRMLNSLTREEHQLTVEAEPTSMVIALHESQVTQILTNLVANASHAIDGPGHIKVTVTRDLHDTELCAVLTVVDDGCGMPPEVLARIFEPLYTTKGASVGTGLGLASVQAILEERGGVVEVQSTVGEGTRFELIFPSIGSCESPPLPSPEQQVGHHSRRALVVDDMPAVRNVLRRLLSRWGFEVTVAEDGQDALEQVQSNPPGHFDVMVTDMMMPRRSGAELTEAAWLHDDAMPVIVLTGFSTEFLPKSGLGKMTCLSKPVQPRRLKSAIDAFFH
jgi:PAS domain S-box-containing protein